MDVKETRDLESWKNQEYRIYPDPPEPWQMIHDSNDPDIHW